MNFQDPENSVHTGQICVIWDCDILPCTFVFSPSVCCSTSRRPSAYLLNGVGNCCRWVDNTQCLSPGYHRHLQGYPTKGSNRDAIFSSIHHSKKDECGSIVVYVCTVPRWGPHGCSAESLALQTRKWRQQHGGALWGGGGGI